MFPSEKQLPYVIALLNTKVSDYILKMINPTMNYGAGTIAAIPVVENTQSSVVEQKSNECTESAKEDWDASETSWEFKKHTLV